MITVGTMLSDLDGGVHNNMGEHRGWKHYGDCVLEQSWAEWFAGKTPKLRPCLGPVWLSGTIVRPISHHDDHQGGEFQIVSDDFRASRIRIGEMRDARGRRCVSGNAPIRMNLTYVPGGDVFGRS